LFKKDTKKVWSETALDRLNKRIEKSTKARESVQKRWKKYERNTNVLQTKNDCNTSKVKESKVKESKVKIKFADTVFLLKNEYDKLIKDHGNDNTNLFISVLDNYKGSNGKKYKSDYKAILSWVIDKTKKENKYKSKTIPLSA